MGLMVALVSELDRVGDWGLMTTDADLKLTSWNRWLELKTGMLAGDVVGRPLLDVFPTLVTRRIEASYRHALDGQTVLLSQRLHKHVFPMGTTIGGIPHAQMQQTIRIVPLVENDTVCGTLTMIDDVTERVVYEEELRSRARQQAALAALARSSLAGRDVREVAGEVVGRVREILGTDFVEILALQPDGLAWTSLAGVGWVEPPPGSFRWEDAPRTSTIRGSIATSLGQESDGLAVVAEDPYLVAHAVSSSLIVRVLGDRDQPFGLLGTYSRTRRAFTVEEQQFVQAVADVLGVSVQRNRLQDELRGRVEQMAEGDQRKDEFLAMLAHELRNPLAPLSNTLQTLKFRFASQPGFESATAIMERQLAHVTRLVDDLLDVSRISSGKFELRKEWVDLARIASQAVDAVQPFMKEKQHRLEARLEGITVGLEADPDRLEQIIANLLTNAAKYTPAGGTIKLSVLEEAGEAIVRVSDNGIGIRPEMMPRLFDLFQQADRVAGRVSEGLGIGLSLVRTLAEMHGGSVRASSRGPGQGSEFVVRFPVGTHAPRSRTTSQVVDGPARSRRILVTDDNVDSAESLAELLGLLGHEVRTAHDGLQALAEAAAFTPEVVFLDIGLPHGMNGYEVAQRLRDVPGLGGAMLVAVTGYGSAADVVRAKQAGFDHHLTKPAPLDALRRLLAT